MEKTHEQTMGERLKSRRGALALTQRDLSARAGVATDVIVKLEHDARKPRPSTIQRIAEGLGVPAEWLTTGHVEEGLREEQPRRLGLRREKARLTPGESIDDLVGAVSGE